MTQSVVNIVLQNDPKAIEEMKSTIDAQFHSLAMFKALELAVHHARYTLLKPYQGGRSETMVSLQTDTSGQAPDDGQPLVDEAKQLIGELAEATSGEPKPTVEEALAAEKEQLVTELSDELIQLSEEADDSDDDNSDEDASEEDKEAQADEDHETYISAAEECAEAAESVLDALCNGFLNGIEHDKLVALSNINPSQFNDFTWVAADNGLVTIVLKP